MPCILLLNGGLRGPVLILGSSRGLAGCSRTLPTHPGSVTGLCRGPSTSCASRDDGSFLKQSESGREPSARPRFSTFSLCFKKLPCVFYYCRTYYKAVRVGEGGDDEPRPVIRFPNVAFSKRQIFKLFFASVNYLVMFFRFFEV